MWAENFLLVDDVLILVFQLNASFFVLIGFKPLTRHLIFEIIILTSYVRCKRQDDPLEYTNPKGRYRRSELSSALVGHSPYVAGSSVSISTRVK